MSKLDKIKSLDAALLESELYEAYISELRHQISCQAANIRQLEAETARLEGIGNILTCTLFVLIVALIIL